MKLLIGQVLSNETLGQDGYLKVIRLDRKNQKFIDDVYYTSPVGNFGLEGRNGFYSIPAKNAFIIYAETESFRSLFFYLSTVHVNITDFLPKDDEFIADKSKEINGFRSEGLIPKGLYNTDGLPQQTILSDDYGNNLTLSNFGDKSLGIKRGVFLKSGFGKSLMLNDSPDNNAIRLLNEEGHGISIAGAFKQGFKSGFWNGSNEISIKTKNDIDIASDAGIIKISSRTGNGIEIECEGIGLNNAIPRIPYAAPWTPLEVPLTAPGPFFNPYGCVKLDSKYRDICIFSGKGNKDRQTLGSVAWLSSIHRSRVMVRAYGETGSVQIRSDGSITISAPNNRVYVHAGSLHMLAEDSLNLRSKGSVNILASSISMMTAPDIEENRFVPRIQGRLATDFQEYAYDYALYQLDDSAFAASLITPVLTPPGAFSTFNMSLSGVSIDGPRIDLAPVLPQAVPLRAIHPMIELSDYEIPVRYA